MVFRQKLRVQSAVQIKSEKNNFTCIQCADNHQVITIVVVMPLSSFSSSSLYDHRILHLCHRYCHHIIVIIRTGGCRDIPEIPEIVKVVFKCPEIHKMPWIFINCLLILKLWTELSPTGIVPQEIFSISLHQRPPTFNKCNFAWSAVPASIGEEVRWRMIAIVRLCNHLMTFNNA